LTEINAPLATKTDPLSLISGLQAPVESTNESATPLQDFSCLLTELIGSLEQSAPAPATNTAQPVPVAEGTFGPETPGLVPPAIFVEQGEAEESSETNKGNETKAAKQSKQPSEQKETATAATPELTKLVMVPVEVEPAFHPQAKETVEQNHDGASRQQASIEPHMVVAALQIAACAPEVAKVIKNPELEKAWADVRKFEFKVEQEAPQRPAQPLQAPAAMPEASQKQLMITTDPMINLRQDKLPPRIVLVQNSEIETRLPERNKSDAPAPVSPDAPAPGTHFGDVIRTVDQPEQARPAQPVEIPELPQPKVVRSVAMEVGDSDSQVVIRIQERGGDVSLQLNAANEPMRHNLESSVTSLLDALKQQEVKVSNVEVFRKQPIDRVRRMKEAR
jgi:hypothetical protein